MPTYRSETGRVAAVFDDVKESVRQDVARELSTTIAGEVRFDRGSRVLYATDASNYRQVPLGLVVPRSVEDVVQTVAVCRRYDVPLLPRGGGTSLAGESCNVAVVIDFSKHLNRVRRIDAERRLAEVDPGCVLDRLREAAEEHHLTFGPDPATHDHNTMGGMIGNNSCGVHSVMAGRTSDNVAQLDVITYDGLRLEVGPTTDQDLSAILAGGGRRAEIYARLDLLRHQYAHLIRTRFPRIPRRVSGYENLDMLLPENGFNVARALVGTEATCVTVLGATLNLVPSPPCRVLGVVGFNSIFSAADAVPEVLRYGPIGLEAIDDLLVEFMRKKHLHADDLSSLPAGSGWLIAEFGADDDDAAADQARQLLAAFEQKSCGTVLVKDRGAQKKIWELRETALAATAHVPEMAETWPGWEDSAVPPASLGNYLRDLKKLFHEHGYRASVYGHFGDGLVHCRIPFDLRTETGVANWQNFLDRAADLIVRYGGSMSGEHGDGQARGALIEKMYGPELIDAFRQFKAIWDPTGRMNPGKVIDPFPIASNLRVGPAYQPREVDHYFAYREDGGSFTKATRRCVGVGSCRRTDSDKGVMCPSYMATREEKHSTRGRARLLFEMLHGGTLGDGWRSAEVEDALNLCLACKGCKSDCPVNVDMATYKAEFRAHHYARRLRPRAAYTMGFIHRWSRLASAAPAVANALTQTDGLSFATKYLAGISPRRTMPRYAAQTFTKWFKLRKGPMRPGKRVLLWPDTFNNHFRASTAAAAANLLESLGYQVVIPEAPVCCGRPLYDWGWLDRAKVEWKHTMDVLRPELVRGTPIVGLEPACVSAFRDELPGLFPSDERARRLSESMLFLTEFLDREQAPIAGAHRGRKTLVQFHCHHHAVLDTAAERRVLDQLDLDYQVMASGCCGMAGSFGMEVDKFDVSMAAAERMLLPTIRKASPQTLIIANGFSCREQIEQGCGQPTVHIAEVIAAGGR